MQYADNNAKELIVIFSVDDDGTERFMAEAEGSGRVCISGQREDLAVFLELAEDAAKKMNKKMRVVRFTTRNTVGEFE